mmetsp:Transcript_15495/g.39376  ORF Transcript_15495/g.39376 Transcript_15495/m.39376 type:complete len:86 (-) Transcript_15495:9-266(-)
MHSTGGTTAPGMGYMVPPRWLRARLHDAGATDALPPEVRSLLRQRGGPDMLTGAQGGSRPVRCLTRAHAAVVGLVDTTPARPLAG